MKMKKIIIAFGLSILLISGCATHTVKQSKDLSASGIAYTEAVDKLLDNTFDRIIDFDNEELKKARGGSDLKRKITDKNQLIISLLTEIERFRAQTKILKLYFLNLQALADSSVKDDAGGAVKSLSDSLSNLNTTLDKGGLTENQKTQIGALGGVLAGTVHAAKIRNALKRDAEVIGTFLALQENQLKNITNILERRLKVENDLFLNEKVIAPYVDKDKSLKSSWGEDRKQWLKTQFIGLKLNTASNAAKQLRGVWADILQGRTDVNSLSLLISDINEFVIIVQELKDKGNTE
jgi:hypothetical protein